MAMLAQATRVRLGTLIGLLALAVAWGATADARADVSEYGIESVSASLSTLEAGRHPDLVTEIKFNETAEPVVSTESLSVGLPPGLVANPQRFPACPLSAFNEFLCPQGSQIGLVDVTFAGFATKLEEPLYILASTDEEIVRLGFIGLFFPYYLEVDLRSESDYGVTVTSRNLPTDGPPRTPSVIKARTWGVPADPVHDTERITPEEAFVCTILELSGPCLVGGSRPSELPLEPFMTNPVNCGPANVHFETTAYRLPGQVFLADASAGEITGCDRVPFEPSLGIKPTNTTAGAPTGLEATLRLPQDEAVNTVNTSPVRSAKVTLPEGFQVNSSAANGLQACNAEQVGYKTRNPAQCPDASKVGSAEIVSASLKRPIKGGIFLRTPESGHLFRFWLVSDELGVNLKLPAEVELNGDTGQITTVIAESPQLPAQEVVLRLNGGPRAPLRNPKRCGTSNATYEFQPWSGGPPATGIVPISIDQGCKEGGFNPKLSAGTVSPTAGAFSPFVFDVMREDGEQDLLAIDLALPAGLTAKLAGVALCPDASASTGACPPVSRIGVVQAATGAGSQPLWIPQPGKSPTAVYLAGPYKGAPYSVVASVPAQAGPFDLGTVSVRSGIYVDPETARVTVKSDPLPQILQGIPIDYRHARVEVDREQFTLNPTSCAVKAVRSTILSTGGAVAHPQDRFQAADCGALGFAPTVSLKLSGETKRSGHPQLRAIVKAKPGDANIRRASVALPHSEFLEQAHIQTVCTRVQFAAETCPRGAIYGHARVTTPLLDKPLAGPVYLRSSSHPLPDLVIDLRGQLHVALVGRIDSIRGGIRTTFDSAPDAPFEKLVLNMKGGQQSLLVNSTNLCQKKQYAAVRLIGHNAKRSNSRVLVRNGC